MSNQPPFELRIFVADGDPDGLRLVTRSNWIGKAIVFPRARPTNFPIPKGLLPKAQGCALRATLGNAEIISATPKGLRHAHRQRRAQPRWG